MKRYWTQAERDYWGAVVIGAVDPMEGDEIERAVATVDALKDALRDALLGHTVESCDCPSCVLLVSLS